MFEKMFERQNDDKALAYLKAYAYCERKDRSISIWSLIISLAFFLAAVITRFLSDVHFSVSLVINILTVGFLIAQIFISMVARHANRDSARFLSLYECYVYNIPVNKAIVASFTQNETEAYARKMHKHPGRYINYLFKSPEDAANKFSVYDKQYKIVKDQDLLMKFSKPFFFTMWIGFIVAVVIIALTDTTSTFAETFVNMSIPSLPIISLIIRNWQIFNESSNRLKNTLGDMDKKREKCKKSWSTAELQEYLLQAQSFNQDAIFLLRLLEFTVPAFLEKRSQKYHSRPMHEYVEVAEPAAAPLPLKTKVKKEEVKAEESIAVAAKPAAIKREPAKEPSAAKKEPVKETVKAPAKKEPWQPPAEKPKAEAAAKPKTNNKKNG